VVGHLARSDVIDGVQAVFAVAATIALAGLVIVLALKEVPLSSRSPREDAQSRLPGGESHATAR
jgi:hypothetical protein